MAPLLSLLCLISIGQPEPADAAKEELKKFQGTWKIEAQDEDGKKLADAELKARTISFGSSLFLVRKDSAMQQLGKIKIDPAKKSINMTVQKGAHEGDLLPGIYELKGDTLKICVGADGDTRPKDFKPGADRLLMICKRMPAKANEGDLSGKYRSDSIDISGKRLKYDTAIERIGDAYLVLYSVEDKLLYVGTGIRRGNVFAVAWVSQGAAGLSVYQIEEGNRMVGDFTEVSSPGFLGSEILTPVPKDGKILDARAGRVR